MRISVEWDNDQHTILHWVFQNRWTWVDYAAAQKVANQLLEKIDHPVDVIGDLQNSASLPANALTAYRDFVETTADNVDLIVLVGASRFVKAMVGVFLRVMPGKTPGTHFVFADTLDRAYTLIAAHQAERQSQNS
jgi:hypothetical protein